MNTTLQPILDEVEPRARQLNLTPTRYLHTLGRDYIFFVEEIWHWTGLEHKDPLGWVDYDMLRYAVGDTPDATPGRGILAPRFWGKTTKITQTLPLYDGFRDPDFKSAIISKSDRFARTILFGIRSWMLTVPFLRHMLPHSDARGELEWRDNSWELDFGTCIPTKDPSIFVAGIEGQLEGRRAHRLIGDDIETERNTVTLEARNSLNERVKEFRQIAQFGPAEIVYCGTYHHEDSVYVKLHDRGYQFRTWPLITPHHEDHILGLSPAIQQRIDDGRLRPGSARGSFDGDIIAPYRHDRAYAQKMLAEGRHKFAMQQMLISDLGESNRYPLKLENLIVLDALARDSAPTSLVWGKTDGNGRSTLLEDIDFAGWPGDGLYRPVLYSHDWKPYIGTKTWIDPAKGGDGNDRLGFAHTACGHGYIWLKHVDGLEGRDLQRNLETIARSARRHGSTEIHVEDFALQHSYAMLLEPIVRKLFVDPGQADDEGITYPNGWRCNVIPTKPPGGTGNFKEARIIGALDGPTSMHRLVVARSVAENQRFQQQYSRITRERGCLSNDDELEAAAMAVWLWSDSLSLSPEEMEARYEQQRIDDELRKMYELAGATLPEPRWFQHH